MSKCILLAFLTLVFIETIPVNAQSVQCDKECVSTIRDLLKDQKQKISTSWSQKANRSLGDSVSVGTQKIFTKKSILASENIRLFLPVIREAFKDRGMITESDNKKPTVTLALLNGLKGKVKNPALREEIIDTINEIVSFTDTPPTTHYPRLIRAEMPLYPAIAGTANISGTVEILVTVERGTVIDAQVQSSSSPLLSIPTVANLKTWQFASEDAATFLVKYVYEINGNETPLPENPRVELDLPRLVRITVRPFRPTSTHHD